jgi:serine/threonine protein kinase
MVVFVPETSNVASTNSHLALGFHPPSIRNVDQTISTIGLDFKGSYGKLYKKGNPGSGVKVYRATRFDDLSNYSVHEDMTEFSEVFNKVEDKDTNFVVKVTHVKTYRSLLTCYKEACMTNIIYNSTRNGVVGSDIVCKPFLCMPVYTKKKWAFVFVSSFATGVPVANLLGFFGRFFRGIDSLELHRNLTEACDNLWKLGFAHNDIHPNNIIYDSRTNKVTFIDLETSVQLTDDIVEKYNEERKVNKDKSCSSTFNSIMQNQALHLLRHSEEWLHQFTTKNKGECRLLYNVDGEFLSGIEDILNI